MRPVVTKCRGWGLRRNSFHATKRCSLSVNLSKQFNSVQPRRRVRKRTESPCNQAKILYRFRVVGWDIHPLFTSTRSSRATRKVNEVILISHHWAREWETN